MRNTLGRLISEQLSSRISQLGNNVVEMKLRNSVFIKQHEGEFLLTREIRELASAHNAGAVMVGTYADGNTFVFVSLKLIDPANGFILSSHDYALPMDRQVAYQKLGNQHGGNEPQPTYKVGGELCPFPPTKRPRQFQSFESIHPLSFELRRPCTGM
jgi:hypothetical protein